MSAAIQLSLSTVKSVVGYVELKKEAMCWADAAAACAGSPLPCSTPVLENTSQNRTGIGTLGLHHKWWDFVQSLTFPWSIVLVVQVLPEEGLKFSFLL